MELTDALLGEHAVIYELFDQLRETVRNSNDIADIRRACATVEKVILSHARIEDELLFPSLEPHLGPMGPLAVMRAEHQEIDESLEALRSETDVAALKGAIGQFLALAAGHFQKEEMVLFGMTRQCLDESKLQELGQEWGTRRSVDLSGSAGAA
ncbi:MAG: hemerythrin domain-containing protein [Alphaproteobacteria bacterium]|jgi:hemerythrin-like domain-containing protein|nr:hemerythrin domain-containing protein [Alphaproteobacteria bacterium]